MSYSIVSDDIDYIDDIIKDMEIIQVKKEMIKRDNETQTDDNQLLHPPQNTSEIKQQTTDLSKVSELDELDELSEINILKIDIEALKIKNLRLEKNFKEICNLLVMFTKIDVENPEIDKIRRQLTILVNRELRMHYAFPFVNILSNIK